MNERADLRQGGELVVRSGDGEAQASGGLASSFSAARSIHGSKSLARLEVPDVNRPSPPSFPAVYRDHAARIRRAIARAGVPARHRDDVTQEALLRIHEALPRYEADRKLISWVLRITYFAAADHLRRSEHREQPTAEIDLMDERTEKRTPEQEAETREAERVFCDAAAVLPEAQRIVFLMHEIDDLTLPDIAEALEIPLGTASSRLQRARQGFEAAVARRRVIEERKLGGAAMLPAFLVSSETLIEAGRALPEVSPDASARMWGRISRATATGAAAGALSRLAALTPRQVISAIVLAGGTGLVVGVALTAGMLSRAPVGAEVAVAGSVARVESAVAPPLPVAASAAALSGDRGAAVVEPSIATSSVARALREPEPASRAERILLDQAQASLRQKDAEAALRALAKHAAQFPAGIYAEERESLRRQVAALLGQDAPR